jgi:hypothetical protein
VTDVTVTAVVSDQGKMVIFDGRVRGVPMTFAADHRAASAILEALRAGETPVVDVPQGPHLIALGCPEWCMYEDIHDAEKRARLAAEVRDDPIVTCEGYGAPVNEREEGLS